MLYFCPGLFKVCTSWVPTDVIMTLFVGVGVSLFVPPLMNVIDALILKSAHKDKAKAKDA